MMTRKDKRQQQGRGKDKPSIPLQYTKRLGYAMNCDYVRANVAGRNKQNKEPVGMLGGARVLNVSL